MIQAILATTQVTPGLGLYYSRDVLLQACGHLVGMRVDGVSGNNRITRAWVDDGDDGISRLVVEFSGDLCVSGEVAP